GEQNNNIENKQKLELFLRHPIFNDEKNIQIFCRSLKSFSSIVEYLTEFYWDNTLNVEHFRMILEMDEFKKPRGRYLPRVMMTYYKCTNEVIDRNVIKVIYNSLSQSLVEDQNSLCMHLETLINDLYTFDMLTPEIICYVFESGPFVCHAKN